MARTRLDRNGQGYRDPTAQSALTAIRKEERRQRRRLQREPAGQKEAPDRDAPGREKPPEAGK